MNNNTYFVIFVDCKKLKSQFLKIQIKHRFQIIEVLKNIFDFWPHLKNNEMCTIIKFLIFSNIIIYTWGLPSLLFSEIYV